MRSGWRNDTAVVGLCCDFFAQQEQFTANILGAMLNLSVEGGSCGYTGGFSEGQKEFGGRGFPLSGTAGIPKTLLPRVGY